MIFVQSHVKEINALFSNLSYITSNGPLSPILNQWTINESILLKSENYEIYKINIPVIAWLGIHHTAGLGPAISQKIKDITATEIDYQAQHTELQ